ncbi:MAG: TIGR00730 family Rossman fold protein [Acidobacteria bacterium]|nr:TIGR00730 family Rossman fold protein [Acidobacteriota bacterium]
MKTIGVFCGARTGERAAFGEGARALGEALGHRGFNLVYGGGKVGLMGILADAALRAGAHVVGVIPDFLVAREVGHTGLSEMITVTSMHDRKATMAERSDAFIAMPGGIGTLEELFEVWTWSQLELHRKPLGLLNIDNYFDSLIDFVHQAGAQGFIPQQSLDQLSVANDPKTLLDDLAQAPETRSHLHWERRI